MESEPSRKEPERPEAHPGSGDEADAREPHGDLLRAKTDLPAEGKTQSMQKGDQSEDDPRDEEERLLMRHRDLPSLLRFKPCEEHRQQVHRTGLTSEPLIAPLLPFPEGAKRAVFAQGLRITIGYSGNLGGLCVFVLYSIAGLE